MPRSPRRGPLVPPFVALALTLSTLALMLVGCRYLDRIDREMAWSVDTGLCGWNVVVDRQGVLWKESGCENGRPKARRVRRLQADEEAELARAIAQLPVDREALSPAEAAPVIAAFDALTRLAEMPCHIPPTLTGRGLDGRLHAWTVAACEVP